MSKHNISSEALVAGTLTIIFTILGSMALAYGVNKYPAKTCNCKCCKK